MRGRRRDVCRKRWGGMFSWSHAMNREEKGGVSTLEEVETSGWILNGQKRLGEGRSGKWAGISLPLKSITVDNT